MTQFIRTNAGYISLDEIAGAKNIQIGGHRPGQRGTRRPLTAAAQFFGSTDEDLGIGPALDLEALTSPLVPSTATVIAVMPNGATTAHPIARIRLGVKM